MWRWTYLTMIFNCNILQASHILSILFSLKNLAPYLKKTSLVCLLQNNEARTFRSNDCSTQSAWPWLCTDYHLDWKSKSSTVHRLFHRQFRAKSNKWKCSIELLVFRLTCQQSEIGAITWKNFNCLVSRYTYKRPNAGTTESDCTHKIRVNVTFNL